MPFPRTLASLATALILTLAGSLPAALAAPPPNDSQFAPGAFEPYTAANGISHELQAFAELAEAAPDAGVPRCLGPTSFERTAWFRIEGADVPQVLDVEAVGRTLSVVDLAAFVQPEGATAPLTRQPNACSGIGSGGADAAEEPTSGVELRVPARRAVLIQVGRHGPRGSADDERVLLSLDARPAVPAPARPAGDTGVFGRTPAASNRRATLVRLAGSTITEEDPAQPVCPSMGTVWRRLVPNRNGPRVISVTGSAVSTFAVFQGRRPTGDNAIDCVVRSAYGPLQMRVKLHRHRPLWIRLGSDQPPSGARGAIRVLDGGAVIDAGAGGFDPTTGGPGGGLPAACGHTQIAKARVSGRRIGGRAAALNRRGSLRLGVKVRGTAVCDVTLELVGPRGRVYATGRVARLTSGRVSLRRTLALRRGLYRLRVTAISEFGEPTIVNSSLRGRLR